MTARRSSATERRGVGSAPRPAALSAAALAVVMAGSGCASRNANTAGMAAPRNQDTAAAVAKDGGLPRPPAARAYAGEAVTELPSATSTPPAVVGTPPTTIETNTGGDIVALINKNPLSIGLTPMQNPAAPKPVLEVVGMPTWLWIEGLPPVMEVTTTDGAGNATTVRVWAALDRVTWQTDATNGPTFTCGGAKGYGIPYNDIFQPTGGAGAPNACVNTFTAPYYAGGGGAPATGAGVYTLTGSVDFHIEFTESGSTGKITRQGQVPVAGVINLNVKTNSTQIRVGEIQALATTP
ncbi:MAG: hypothetical protein HOV87_26270 [Catenulispora sp.]|nr:hypothetical protein [Catenulispora sp.]